MFTLPFYIPALLIACVLFTLYMLGKATNAKVIGIASIWLIVQGIIALTGFYTNTASIPPPFLLLLIPPFALIAFLFNSKKGLAFIDRTDKKTLTWLHTVRIPVEIMLFLLFTEKMIPELMTFEGRNFDILAGLTAPVIAWFGYHKFKLSKILMIGWNIICIGLLLNIVIHALLSAPFPFQKMAFDQPNIALFYFPFIYLPGFIVPVVFFSHFASLRALFKGH
ncbi:MAG: hypothetical protein ACI959_001843 [Limisphaerales bacterium]|jgi:hypothetical protein